VFSPARLSVKQWLLEGSGRDLNRSASPGLPADPLDRSARLCRLALARKTAAFRIDPCEKGIADRKVKNCEPCHQPGIPRPVRKPMIFQHKIFRAHYWHGI
jgi:hypothetical protein